MVVSRPKPEMGINVQAGAKLQEIHSYRPELSFRDNDASGLGHVKENTDLSLKAVMSCALCDK